MSVKPLILATGLQSGGTTLVSHAFLQHPEVDGILDMASDRIEMNFARVCSPVVWVKMTTISFRWHEVAAIYATKGYDVFPFMIVRNPFDAWVSLKEKWYGLNGVTAEDPPLMIRFMRFFEDWQSFIRNDYPILQFEAYTKNPETSLREACDTLPIDFDEAMLKTSESIDSIAYVSESNQSFISNLSKGVQTSVAKKSGEIAKDEYDWLCEHFADLIDTYGYTNRHQVTGSKQLAPNPFDARRYLGFGSSVLEHLVSKRLPVLFKECEKHNQQGHGIVIYGPGDFGEYLAEQIEEVGLPVKGFIDSFTPSLINRGKWRVENVSSCQGIKNQLYILASFQNAASMRDTLERLGALQYENVFSFGRM